jgi:hypothetical protein
MRYQLREEIFPLAVLGIIVLTASAVVAFLWLAYQLP